MGSSNTNTPATWTTPGVGSVTRFPLIVHSVMMGSNTILSSTHCRQNLLMLVFTSTSVPLDVMVTKSLQSCATVPVGSEVMTTSNGQWS